MTQNADISVLVEDVRRQREALEKKEKKIDKLEKELKEKLEKVTRWPIEDAKKELLLQVEKDLKAEIATKIRLAEEKIKLDAKEKSREILADVMRQGITQYVAEYTVSVVDVPNEDVKGRIIGAGGRNIRTFEKEAQVELELDENSVIRISSFDAVRREIAKRALLVLIGDSRIQPSRIEEVVRLTKTQMEDVLLEEGKKIAEECGIFNLPVEIIKLIGKYKFRTSYGQNLGIHTIEETKMGVALAAEIGANVETVRLGCLLHDIGKVVVDEEGTHVDAGVAVLKRHGFPKEVVATVAEHHEDKPFSAVESICVWIADSISGSRPGARYEPHEGYVTRMSKIEEIAGSFDGVETAFAFQAGRDVRVIVKPDVVDDDKLTVLAHDIAKRLEAEVEYAGQIKVTAIREVRATGATKAK